MSNEIIIQGFIVLLSGGSIWLLAQMGKFIRWGHIVGMVSVPLWLYTTWANEQWGMFLNSLWFAYCYYKGIKNFWFKGAKS
jgi:hypothetical protein